MDPATDKPSETGGPSQANGAARGNGAEHDAGADGPHPARALTLHLLRMLETRMDAAGIALQSEVDAFRSRLQLKLVAGATLFLAVWAGIVLLAIALPEAWRIPVLSVVVGLLVIAAIWAQLASKRNVSSDQVGSMSWFLEGLKLDLEVLSRSLNRARAEPRPEAPRESTQ
jgi:uncharacterized membrane protein YqjE